MSRNNLHAFENLSEAGIDNSAPVSCFLAKVYYFWERRNAYSSTWAYSEYFMPFGLTRRQVEQDIEPSRRQGSQWFLDELPALVVCSDGTSLIIVQKGPHPLKNVRPLANMPSTLVQVAKHFSQSKWLDIRLFVCRRDRIFPAQLPFRR